MATRWCFTINNYSDEDIATLSSWDSLYLIYGKELSESGTPHLQGFVTFKKQKRLSACKKLHSTAHWEAAKGTSEQAADYCKKEGNFEEKGSLPSSGKRNDLESFKDAVKKGILDKKRLREEFSDICAKYPRFVNEYVSDNIPIPEVKKHALKQWQADLNQRLLLPPNDREIIFIVDTVGNKGKSWFSKYYQELHPDSTSIMRPTKHADMAYALPDQLRVFFLDCTRTQLEHLPYSFLESLKDGLVMSNKYESRVRRYSDVHIVVLLNQSPDMTALSEDRYSIVDLN